MGDIIIGPISLGSWENSVHKVLRRCPAHFKSTTSVAITTINNTLKCERQLSLELENMDLIRLEFGPQLPVMGLGIRHHFSEPWFPQVK